MKYVYVAILDRVIDAATYSFRCDVSGEDGCTQRVILAGLSAPRVNTAEGVIAARWAEAWLRRHAPADPPALWLVTNQHRRRKKGLRFKAIVFAPDGACLNRDLIAAEHATARSESRRARTVVHG